MAEVITLQTSEKVIQLPTFGTITLKHGTILEDSDLHNLVRKYFPSLITIVEDIKQEVKEEESIIETIIEEEIEDIKEEE